MGWYLFMLGSNLEFWLYAYDPAPFLLAFIDMTLHHSYLPS